jgi:hypothetical protein
MIDLRHQQYPQISIHVQFENSVGPTMSNEKHETLPESALLENGRE